MNWCIKDPLKGSWPRNVAFMSVSFKISSTSTSRPQNLPEPEGILMVEWLHDQSMRPLIYFKMPVIAYDTATDLQGSLFLKEIMQIVSHLYSHFDKADVLFRGSSPIFFIGTKRVIQEVYVCTTPFSLVGLGCCLILGIRHVAVGPNWLQEKEERRQGF